VTVSERGYLSIGEVLALLQEEFPDVTISKIRFLESQGLIEPERTPSGYRKFYGIDVDRLRFILREQRENYLPLRVIRDRLDAPPADDDLEEIEATPRPVTVVGDGSIDPPDAATLAPSPVDHVPVWMRKAPPGVQRTPEHDRTSHPSVVATPPASLQLVSPTARVTPAPLEAEPDGGTQLSLDELATTTGVDIAELRDLERFGIITAHVVGRTSYYGDDAVRTAALAAGFLRHGIEARHLRMYKQAAERETALFEQVVAPLAKQRNPRARIQATEAVRELADHGAALRALLVAQALRELHP
jgi:DNA-binding transcriptional MerR regulator